MPNMQETIKRAVELMGPEILENTRNFSNILEDLAPELVDERKFIAKIYSDDVGKLVAGTYKADISARKDGVREIDIFLDNENGINESWRKRFLEYFYALFASAHAVNRMGTVQTGQPVKPVNVSVDRAASVSTASSAHTTATVPSAAATSVRTATATKAVSSSAAASPVRATSLTKNASNTTEESKRIYEEAMQADLKGDYETAVKLLSQIKDGSEFEVKAAMYLAEHYSEEKPKWSFALYLRAASLGNARAQFLVGYMYEYGEGVAKSIKGAVEWYTRAAANGDRGAQHNLGFFYYSGTGVEQNYKKAFEYFQMAALQGKPDSMRNVGVMYQLGQYVKKDMYEALKWYKAAADNGDANALKDYENLKKLVK